MSGFTSLQNAVAAAGGSIVQRSRITFAPVVLKTVASFDDSNMLAFVVTNLTEATRLLSNLNDDDSANVVMIDGSDVRDNAGQQVSFASLKSHVQNTCKSRNVPVAINVVKDSDGSPMGFTVRKLS